jgi:peroxiredoxin
MNNALVLSSILLWAVVLFNLLLTIALIRKSSTAQPGFDMAHIPTLEVGSQAPEFTAETLDGKTVTLADYTGKTVAVIFISASCKPCLEKLPSLNKLSQRAKSFGMELVLVNIGNKEETKELIQQQNILLPTFIAHPTINPFMRDYKVAGTPYYCVVDEDGKVVSTGFVDPKWDEFVNRTFVNV